MSTFVFTTSWDDGSALDMRIADMLDARGMRGTFYVPQAFTSSGGKYASYGARLTDEQIRSLAARHEVGSHGLTHRPLVDMPHDEARGEIFESKKWLEGVSGQDVRMFCYPLGKYTEEVRQMAADAGYAGARTTRKLQFERASDPYAMGVSLLINPYPLRRKDALHIYWRRALDPLRAYGGDLLSYPELWRASWGAMARAMFARARREGTSFHLYGHSWEIEQYGMWGELESFLDFVAQQGVEYKTNGECIR